MHNENRYQEPERTMHLEDVISNILLVTKNEKEDELPYSRPTKTKFKQY